MSSLGSSFKSLRQFDKQEPKALIFPSEWRKGPVFEDWYNTLKPEATRIARLEIRKDTSGPVPHRFIIVHMTDGSTHRFDRRPDHEETGAATGPILLANSAVKTKDEYITKVSPVAWIQLQGVSYCEIELRLGGRVDLLAVLSACYSISQDQSAYKYTLFNHNCFFFSWTILMVVFRHYIPHEVPSYDPVAKRFRLHIGSLTNMIVEDAIKMFVEMVIDTVTVFREKAREVMFKGMGSVGITAWSLPIGVLRFLWRRVFGLRLQLGLRKQLIQAVRSALETKLLPVYKDAMGHLTAESLDNQLWLKDLDSTFREPLQAEILKILWDVILDAIAGGCGDMSAEQISKLTNPDMKYVVLVKNVVQFCSVWNAVLHRALPAARDAARGKSTEGGRNLTHAEMFDKAWAAAQTASLETAKTVVQNTRDQVGHFEARDMMWSAIWEVWDDAWGSARINAQKSAVRVVENVMEQLLTIGASVLMDEMRDTTEKYVEARVFVARKRWWRSQSSLMRMSNAALQDYMQKAIKADTLGSETLKDVGSTMSRIWAQARSCLHEPVLVATQAVATATEIAGASVAKTVA